jgi:uncharacterized protein
MSPASHSTSFAASRRQFLAALAGAVAFSHEAMAMQQPSANGIPVRKLGKSGVQVSIVAIGGYDFVVNKTDDEGVRLLHEALDGGITFWDNAWEYNDGRSEEVMGKAFDSPSRRDRVYLMTKVCGRDYVAAKRHIEDSLRRLRTDRIDLLQFHSLQYPGDQERIMDPENGAVRAALEAQQAGKVIRLGFTGHQRPDVHLGMLKTDFDWVSVQMPLNILDAHYLSFEKQVLPVCRSRDIGVLGMKSLAAQNARIVRDLKVDWELCRRYALSLPVSSLVCGVQTIEQLRSLLRLAQNFKPLGDDDIQRLLSTSRNPSQDGHIEQYKNPQSGYGCSYHSRILEGRTAAHGEPAYPGYGQSFTGARG